jgi:HSP20 family molecular chaperone IbpA
MPTRRLPRNADMQRVSASLVHGVLTVAVPKAPAVDVAVTVETNALPDDLPEPRGQVSLALPGLGASDVNVTITRDHSLWTAQAASLRGRPQCRHARCRYRDRQSKDPM